MEIWDRQIQETERQYHGFVHYRDLRERSLAKAFQEHKEERNGKGSFRRWCKWSKDNAWVQRAAAYDVYLDFKLRKEKEGQYQAAIERHERASRLLQAKLVERLSGLKPSEIPVSCIAPLFKVAVEIERLALEKPTEILRHETVNDELMAIVQSNPALRDKLLDAFYDAAETKDEPIDWPKIDFGKE